MWLLINYASGDMRAIKVCMAQVDANGVSYREMPEQLTEDQVSFSDVRGILFVGITAPEAGLAAALSGLVATRLMAKA